MNEIKIDENLYSLETHIYYEGPKEEIIPDLNTVLLWYDISDTFETWFFIQSTPQDFSDYLENKICLLSLIQKSQVFTFNRNFNDYDNISEKTLITDLNSYELPSSGVYFTSKG